jgi:hypothetical protein
MNHALILNLLIVGVVVLALAITSQPVVLLGLLMLRDMPYGLLAVENDDEEEEGKPMGFIHPEK